MTRTEAEAYKKDPCRASSLPFWKIEQTAIPPHLRIIRDDEMTEDLNAGTDDPYFKTVHRLNTVPDAALLDGFRVISLEGLIEMKTALGREKDLRDVERIRAFRNGKGAAMEEQTITITVKSRGEPCEMTDAEIKAWYEARIAALFDPKWGTPEITVDVKRKQT